jgi:delta l-pyrroline-5-carboxylate synthetase
MQSKVKAALRAVKRINQTTSDVHDQAALSPSSQAALEYSNEAHHLGAAVDAVLIVNGHSPRAAIRALAGEDLGTLVVSNIVEWDPTLTQNQEAGEVNSPSQLRSQVERTSEARQALATLSSERRAQLLIAIADALEGRSAEILAANQEDLRQAEANAIAPPLLKRLKLSEEKLETLAMGIRDIANMEEPIGRTLSALEVSPQLDLTQVSAPIGVLLVIFESRPDSLPQIAALSLRSGNGLILKGGKEAECSNRCLHTIITETVEEVTAGKVSGDVISLVTTRAEIGQLLELDDLIDLVVPRGSNALVRHIQNNTKIPVLGHADGVCHIYVDADADVEKAVRICVDAKTNYPAACNAMETILLHRDLLDNGHADLILRELRRTGVTVVGGPRAIEEGLISIGHRAVALNLKESTDPLHVEYGDLTCTCEVVDDLNAAIDHCNRHGSGHTEAIVTESPEHAERFLNGVDSACVFANASTRFADGFRFGLGAEVGISTSRIHARGPVGIEGLLTCKWQLRSTRDIGHTVGEFSEGDGPKYTHIRQK